MSALTHRPAQTGQLRSRGWKLNESVETKLKALRGRMIDAGEAAAVMEALPWVPPAILDLMRRYALANARFSLDESEDESGLGVEMRWLAPDEILDEALGTYPGIAVASDRYLPIGNCLFGTGDPYFVRGDDVRLPVYRIPHDAVTSSDAIAVEQFERVSPSLEAFFSLARTL